MRKFIRKRGDKEKPGFFGSIKFIILATIVVILIVLVMLLVADFGNVANNYENLQNDMNSSQNKQLSSKEKFNKYLDFLAGKQEDKDNASDSKNKSGSLDGLTWGGYDPRIYYLMYMGEVETRKVIQQAEDIDPEVLRSGVGIPWSTNYTWGDNPRPGDGGLGPYQATNGSLPIYITNLYNKDVNMYAELKPFVDDTSLYMDGGNSKYCLELQLALKKCCLKDFNQFMDDSFSILMETYMKLDTVNSALSTIYPGHTFDDLTWPTQSVIVACKVRYGNWNEILPAGTVCSTEEELVQALSDAYYNKNSKIRWKYMIDDWKAMTDGSFDVMGYVPVRPEATRYACTSNWRAWLEKYSNVDTSSGSATGGIASGGQVTGDYLSYKQYAGGWETHMTLDSSSNNMKATGCAVTSVTIMLNKMGITSDNPGQVNNKLKNGVACSGGNIVFGNIGKAYNVTLEYTQAVKRLDLRNESQLKEAINLIADNINNGCEVIINFDYKNDENPDHFVYCTGTTENSILVADPGKTGTDLVANYTGKDRVVITSLRIFKKK